MHLKSVNHPTRIVIFFVSLRNVYPEGKRFVGCPADIFPLSLHLAKL
ncbi:MAG: hypothetical protein CMIDDMOC_00764 [Sodalis sp. Fle]|nr:MAG: hypothetical protein CMIDDMOC_00764 [Sodalis sp. Fle]